MSFTWMAFRRPIDSIEPNDALWIALEKRDCEALEATFQQQNDSTSPRALSGGSTTCQIEYGRYLASPLERKMSPVYWKESDIKLIRATWFYRPFARPEYPQPFGEADSETIEEAVVDLRSGREAGPVDIQLGDSDIGGVVQIGWQKVNGQGDTNELYFALYTVTEDKIPRKLQVLKDFPVNGQETAKSDDRPLQWLMLMTHGIGESLFNKNADSNLGALRFRRHCNRLRESLNAKSPTSRIEILPIEWFSALHIPETVEALRRVTLPTIEKVRDFMNFALRDLLMYTREEWQTRILDEVELQVTTKLSLFLEHNPDFLNALKNNKAGIAFCGHSLGAVILVDLLRTKNLPLVDCMFAFGAPVAPFICSRGESRIDKLPCDRFFNVFHPHDPIAYRVEPMITGETALPPELIPHEGGQRIHVALSNLTSSFVTWWSGSRKSAGGEDEQADPPEVKKIKDMNCGQRIDWELQTSAGEAVNEWISAMSSHFIYWQHEDLHNFIVEQFKNTLQQKEFL